MSSPASVNQIQPVSDTAGAAIELKRVNPNDDVAANVPWNLSAKAKAAGIIAVVSVATFASQRWTQTAPLGEPSPAIWLLIGFLIAGASICFANYRNNLQRRDRRSPEIERLGPYILLKKLGSGGMGDVFLAEHQLMKRQCAVKLIHPNQAKNREMRNSFEREAKATAQLTHWNTIEVYDYGTSDDGRFYYVMEYLKGVNLWEYVEQYGPMSPGRVVYVLKQLCDALYEADCAGLVHRDIKPSNVFLTERGRSFDVAKLLDFGLVQAVTTDPIKLRNVNTKLMGSPSFMCPEQAVGLTPDCRGDLYSLGAVAYFLLTGRPPFVDENPIMLIVAHATTNVPTFEQIGADVPTDLASAILKCLARDPSERFDSARQLLVALEGCQCASDWTWQSAEEWWTTFTPGQKSSPASVTLTPEDTQTMVRNDPNHTDVGIDFHEPTAVYESPQELTCTPN